MLPCVVHEDDDLLVINKPAGMSTHAASALGSEGLFEWLRGRQPRWASLGIIHRLDKETSGIIIFSKSQLASASLTAQFTQRSVSKRYVFLTDRPVPGGPIKVQSSLVRIGDKYVSRPIHAGSVVASTVFEKQPALKDRVDAPIGMAVQSVLAMPLTGRTHQIRVHAAKQGFPVLGDTLYGGTVADRLYLHASEITLQHPSEAREITFSAPLSFNDDSRLALRGALLDPAETDACRLIHGASDGRPGWYVDRLANYLLSQSEKELSPAQLAELALFQQSVGALGVYHKLLARHVQRQDQAEVSPRHVLGKPAAGPFPIRENGLRFELSFEEGYSVGLFLDQRDNRRRLLEGYVAPGFALSPVENPESKLVLNAFAYTCGFSVCAARAGWRTVSLDLSKKYLEWGRRNFGLNDLDAGQQEFIYGDVFDWLGRFNKKRRQFDLILLDPPTFSHSRESGPFRAQTDYGKLIQKALPLLKPFGVLFASSNAEGWPAAEFVSCVEEELRRAARPVIQRHYAPQPPDFPISRAERGYLKTAWFRVGKRP